ncbi:MAG TPA: putative quinol monooxygenase [Chthonomonadaceae bacterium]|nr:putative quinol monooxygenase [Chthonomonadaceae bacterium]
MIVVAGSVTVRPDQRERAVAAAVKMVAATQQEAGCLKYDMYSDLSNPNRIFVFEEWESDAALMAHFQTPHMAEFAGILPEVLAGPPDITRYEVASSARLPVGD